ncbi:hypothetical protein R3X27_11615 [Tropicimonas sp. TH_r6]|uniref:type II toxin-antitoxin system RelE family toxin n=1 Tax=Tropicimonas sp. TH_r6 TaxID=3082085 RepID=UPI0029559053|nr:hypothetical protein [Tropicimonas sp. TH_r6]MDV7143330.1 hypothetical protein [Tropicimonas sp. TH_r6]
MTLIIADSFTDSLAKLTRQEQAAVKQTAFDLQVNPEHPGHSFHRIEKSKDKYFWSVRVNRDIRIIVHKRGDSLLLAYVDHHDDSYKWAEKRRLDIHPRTGAAQIVEIRERVEEVVLHRFAETAAPKPLLLDQESDDVLLDCGVPEDWLDEVRKATEDSLLDICRFLPEEAREAVLNLAVGIRPERRTNAPDADPFGHPDAKRRFWSMNDGAALRRAFQAAEDRLELSLTMGHRESLDSYFSARRSLEDMARDREDRDFSDREALDFAALRDRKVEARKAKRDVGAERKPPERSK